MNNNIFLTKEKQEHDNDKYNPDVMRNYGIIKNLHKKGHDGKFVNVYYKSVTNEPVKTNIKSIKELQLEKDTPDIRTLTNNFDKSIQQRMAERMIVEQSIQRYKRENGIVEKTHDEINREHQLEQQRLEQEKKAKQDRRQLELLQQKKEDTIINVQTQIVNNVSVESNNDVNTYNVTINNLIIDDDEDKNNHANLKGQHKSYVLKDNDKLLKEKKKYNDILRDLEDIL